MLPPLADGVTLKLAPLGAIVSVAAHDGAVDRLGAALGVALPRQPRRITVHGTTWLWSGVDAWLALAGDHALAGRIAAAAPNLAAVVDQSHGRVIMHIAGPRATDTLARLLPIDLDRQSFPPDATALTLAGSIGVQIWRHDAGFALACFTSFAQSLADALAQAGRQFSREG